MMERGQVSWWAGDKGLSSLTQGWWPEETPSWQNVDILHLWPPGYDSSRERGVKEGVGGYMGHSSQILNGLCQEHTNLLTLKTEDNHCPKAKKIMYLLWKCLRWWTQIELKDHSVPHQMAIPLRWGMTNKKDLKTHTQEVAPANRRKWALEQKMEELVS